MSRVTGDKAVSVNSKVASLTITQVLSAELGDKDDPVNQRNLSGKAKGACFITEDYLIAIASGEQPTDKWVLSDGTAITPA